MKQSIRKNGLALAGYAAVCTLLVALVNFLTKDKIQEQQQLVLQQTLNTVVAHDSYDNELLADCIIVSDAEHLGNDKPHQLFRAYKSGEATAAIIETTAPDGYSGSIQLMVGISVDGIISGVQVLQHKETPGLGDKIEARKSDWLKSFIGKRVEGENDKRWAVKKDDGMFDQFTGATITPRAVVKSVKNTALYFDKNKAQLFAEKPSCAVTKGGDND